MTMSIWQLKAVAFYGLATFAGLGIAFGWYRVLYFPVHEEWRKVCARISIRK